MAAERVRLRIGNLAKAVLVSGQAYQDPKDALNEFVSNAADEYAEADLRGGRIRVVLRRRGQRTDSGPGTAGTPQPPVDETPHCVVGGPTALLEQSPVEARRVAPALGDPGIHEGSEPAQLRRPLTPRVPVGAPLGAEVAADPLDRDADRPRDLPVVSP